MTLNDLSPMVEALENSICQLDFNKGQLLPAVLLLENLNLLQFPKPEVQLRGSDEKMLEFKALAVVHQHVIKNYLNVSISEKLTRVAIAYGGRLRHRTEIVGEN